VGIAVRKVLISQKYSNWFLFLYLIAALKPSFPTFFFPGSIRIWVVIAEGRY
jgi:hypothetical protein